MLDSLAYTVGAIDNKTVDGYCDSCGKAQYRLLYNVINGKEYISIICLACGRSVHIILRV